ncbi:MAG TPA: energy-coupling factor transporter transmembrane component T [Brevefilum fermentans]|jgi:energy-coupling factor transport system permease protein|uniref:ABC transporter permease subunit n=1 Tax=Candidatus Brevifilum fermentans TaxID=1986204 RepID=A0A1Y6K5E9_9CHLR|nr:energy-coupling factor transporter transmembrane component T [Brevefilum fermentans]MDI9566867.1 energy-coupling factor transporter transmembrane component T [Chloroflexota bacterium]OQB82898.1 MAG: Energy-coupling factor transporter transmembrane protein EcfT [Chloroflexi bacterium ADurb.Bin120]SMX54905.1 ABC transporter permease subunit [Brevefilum fermentans]HOM67386.1 energy-coupling factor transporter transmembrane component T [Brevefilum fermentans]HPX94931.1 energy-coupling factor tr
MNAKTKLFSYDIIDSPIRSLSGLTKLICFLLLTFAVMYSYDIRVILAVMLFAAYIMKISKIKFSQIKLMVIYVLIFVLTNAVISFLFAPEMGVEIYGTRTVLIELPGKFDITAEQLLYSTTKLFKYSSVIPFGIIFLLTTNPSEFASSLNRIGVHYKVAYAVALTLRYFPDVQRDYYDISQAQQARGLELSRKASLFNRIKNGLLIIIPLIFSSLDRIETISNAMDLRGFGKSKTRTWYTSRKMKRADYVAIFISVLIFIATASVSIFINKSRFYNPFI